MISFILNLIKKIMPQQRDRLIRIITMQQKTEQPKPSSNKVSPIITTLLLIIIVSIGIYIWFQFTPSTEFSDFFEKDRNIVSKLTKFSLVEREKEMEIPSTSGLVIEIGYGGMTPLPAGHTYQEVIFITNYYKDPENENRTINIIDISPYIYHPKYHIYFIPENFEIDKNILKSGEIYGKYVTFDPQYLKVSGEICKYSTAQLEAALEEKKENKSIECSYETPCLSKDNIKSICIETDYLKCECFDWIKTTCSGEPLYMGANITHDGFIIGEGTLYYYESPEVIEPLIKKVYIQEPAKLSFSFIPNPWIKKLYENYIDTVEMIASIEIRGYNSKIKNYEVRPINTKTVIYDYVNNKKIVETIGISKINCTSVEKINEILTKIGKWTGILCYFKPPEITLEIVDLTTNETQLSSSISFAMIDEYCRYSNLNISSESITYNSELYKQYLLGKEKLAQLNAALKATLDKYGFCSFLNRSTEEMNATISEEIETIRKAMKEVNVYVRFEYETTETVESSKISTYWTSKCE